VNELLIYSVILDLLSVAYVQFVILLTELEKVVSQEVKHFFVTRLPQYYQNEPHQNYGSDSLTFL
jgi:hypothetical protein